MREGEEGTDLGETSWELSRFNFLVMETNAFVSPHATPGQTEIVLTKQNEGQTT